MKKVVITGASGFIGRFLAQRFSAHGTEVSAISRNRIRNLTNNVQWHYWDGRTVEAWAKEIDGADMVINLAGKSVDCRYTEKNKTEILTSRIDATTVVAKAIQQAQQPPALWCNASTATIYRHAQDRPMDEKNGEIGDDFSMNVAKAWEKAMLESHTPNTRKVALRISIVLGKGGGALAPFRTIVRLGAGGKQGSGKQLFSWIHEEDLFRIIGYVAENKEIDGAINCTAPNPLPNAEFMSLLRKQLGVPFGVPSPRWLLEIGTFFLRTETELLLKSRWVLPTRLLNAGFSFQYPTAQEALGDIVG